jgi:hypothetical protein
MDQVIMRLLDDARYKMLTTFKFQLSTFKTPLSALNLMFNVLVYHARMSNLTF